MRSEINHFVSVVRVCVLLLFLGLLGLAVLGCAVAPDGGVFEVSGEVIEAEASVSEVVPTVVVVRYEVRLLDLLETSVEFGSDPGCDSSATAYRQADGSFEAILLGSKSSSEVHYRVVARTLSGVYTTPTESILTGPLPPDLPRIDAVTLDPERTPEGFLIISLIGDPFIEAILDQDGDYVWFHRVAPGAQMVTRARLSVDGRSVLYLRENEIYWPCEAYEPVNHIVRVGLDGTVIEEIPVGNAHHDFVEHPDGTLAVINADVREANDLLVQGARILEFAPDGETRVAWSLWDHAECPDWIIGEDAECDWVHANALDYDPIEDVYYLGMATDASIWKIARGDGRVLWQLGMNSPDFKDVDEEATWFFSQHQFDVTGNGLLVFDNGGLSSTRLLEYELNEADDTARQIWEHIPDERFVVYVMGEAQRITPDLTLATWSTAGQVDLITKDHEVIWRLNVAMGAGFGYSSWLESLYQEEPS